MTALTQNQKQMHEEFKAAKQLLLNNQIPNGTMRRAVLNDKITNYSAALLRNRMYVVGDSELYIQNPDILIMGKPAREIFGEFSAMSA